MIPQAMIDAGNAGSTIREIAEHGAQRAKVIGAENVFSFAIGNPSVPAPACVQETIERLLHTMDPSVLHAYTAAPGLESVRQKIADYLQASFGVGYGSSRYRGPYGGFSSSGVGVGVGLNFSGPSQTSTTLEVFMGRGEPPDRAEAYDAREVQRYLRGG